jgi:sulfur-oxidizing protein SoxY
VRYGGTPVMNVDGDISISENPSLHFSFVPEAEGELVVEARDSEGGTFSRSWPVVSDAAS